VASPRAWRLGGKQPRFRLLQHVGWPAQGLHSGQAAGAHDLGHAENLGILQPLGTRVRELGGQGLQGGPGGHGQAQQPGGVLVGEGLGAVGAGARVEAVAQLAQDVVQVIVGHVIELLDEEGGAAGLGQAGQELAAAGRVDPAGAKVLQAWRFLDEAGGQALFVLLDGDGHGFAVDVGEDEAAGVGDVDVKAFDLDGGQPFPVDRLDVGAGLGGGRSELGDKSLAEEAGGVGVVKDAEHELVGGRMETGAAADHLVEGDGRADVLEKDDVADAGDVDAGCEELDGGGDKMGAGGAAKVGQVLRAASRGGALEGVGVAALAAVLGAPGGVEVVHLAGDVVGVAIADAEDDRLLLGTAGVQEVVEEIPAHGEDAIGQEDIVFVAGSGVVLLYLVAHQLAAGGGIDWSPGHDLVDVDARVIQVDAAAHDLAGGQVAVFDALGHVVFVDRLAEIADVVGGDLGVGLRLFGGGAVFELARGGGEADLDGVGVAGEDLGPLAPGGAVALVDDDVAEIVLGVEGGQKVGGAVFGVDVESLVGGDVDAGVAGVVAALGILVDFGGVGAKDVLQGAQALAAEFVAVADKEGAVQLAGVGDALEEVDGDEGLAGAGGQGEEGALGLAGFLAVGDLFQDGADGGVLVVAAGRLAAGVADEERFGSGLGKVNVDAQLVAGAQLVGRRKEGKEPGRTGLAGEAVEFDKEVAVAGKDKGDVEALAGGVELGLLEAVGGREAFGLGFDEGDGDGLGAGVNLNAQGVVGAALAAFVRLAGDDLDGAGGLFAADEVLGPAAGVDGGVD
jgi:hypothetical protein